MSGSLIINARDRLSWQQRFFSDASTVVMWGAWLKLWYPLAKAVALVTKLSILTHLSLMKVASAESIAGVPRYAVALVLTSGGLVVWSRFPSFKLCTPEVRTSSDYAEHFGVHEAELQAGQQSSVCVVHHDESGRIVRIETRSV